MIYLTTKMALNELNKCKITDKDILLDKAIIKHDLNPLKRLFNVVVMYDGDELIKIIHPTESYEQKEWYMVEYKDEMWKII